MGKAQGERVWAGDGSSGGLKLSFEYIKLATPIRHSHEDAED